MLTRREMLESLAAAAAALGWAEPLQSSLSPPNVDCEADQEFIPIYIGNDPDTRNCRLVGWCHKDESAQVSYMYNEQPHTSLARNGKIFKTFCGEYHYQGGEDGYSFIEAAWVEVDNPPQPPATK